MQTPRLSQGLAAWGLLFRISQIQSKPDKPNYTKIKLKRLPRFPATAFLLTAYGSDDYLVDPKPLFQLGQGNHEVDQLV